MLTTVICLHCSGSSPRQWSALATALAPAHRMVAPDLIGYAGTTCNVEAGATLDDEAERIAAIVDAARGPVCLVGHSYGGAVATRVALRRRDAVVGLALYEPVLFSLITRGSDNDPAGREIVATGLAIQADVRTGRVVRAAQHFVDYWSGDGTWQTMDVRRRQAVCVRMPKVAREFAALFDDAMPLSAYARLTMPVLWLEGETTRLPPRVIAGRLLPQLPDARYVRLAAAGHMGPLTHPDAVNAEILPFVRSLDHRHRPGSSRTDAAAADTVALGGVTRPGSRGRPRHGGGIAGSSVTSCSALDSYGHRAWVDSRSPMEWNGVVTEDPV